MIPAYVLIIGAMKSGTTTLFDLLSLHPAIAPCFPKEPGFFAFEDRWAEGFEWYESLFDYNPRTHHYGLDGSTDYSKYPFCAGVQDRLAQSAPRRFKLIYILRDPLSRIESHARHVQGARKEVGQCLSARADHSLDSGISPVSLAVSKYADQLDQYRSYYEAGDLLILTFEEMKRDQAETMTRVLDFLGLEQISFNQLHSNKSAPRHRPRPALTLLENMGAFSRLAKSATPKGLRRAIKSQLLQEVKVEGRFILTANEREDLLSQLGPDVIRLQNEYGIDTKQFWGIG